MPVHRGDAGEIEGGGLAHGGSQIAADRSTRRNLRATALGVWVERAEALLAER